MAKRKLRVTLVSLDRKIDQNTTRDDGRIDHLDRKFDHLDHKFDSLDRKFHDLGHKFHDLSRKFDKTQMLVEGVRDDVQKVAECLVVMDQK